MKAVLKYSGIVSSVTAALLREEPALKRGLPKLKPRLQKKMTAHEAAALPVDMSEEQMVSALQESGKVSKEVAIAAIQGGSLQGKAENEHTDLMKMVKLLQEKYKSGMQELSFKERSCDETGHANYEIYLHEHKMMLQLQAAMDSYELEAGVGGKLQTRIDEIKDQIDNLQDSHGQIVYASHKRTTILAAEAKSNSISYKTGRAILCASQCSEEEVSKKSKKAASLLQSRAPSAEEERACIEAERANSYLGRVFAGARISLLQKRDPLGASPEAKLPSKPSADMCQNVAANCKTNTQAWAADWGKSKSDFMANQAAQYDAEQQAKREGKTYEEFRDDLGDELSTVELGLAEAQKVLAAQGKELADAKRTTQEAYEKYTGDHHACEQEKVEMAKKELCQTQIIYQQFLKQQFSKLFTGDMQYQLVEGKKMKITAFSDLKHCELDSWEPKAGEKCGEAGLAQTEIKCRRSDWQTAYTADGKLLSDEDYVDQYSSQTFVRNPRQMPSMMWTKTAVVKHPLSHGCIPMDYNKLDDVSILNGNVSETTKSPCNVQECEVDCVYQEWPQVFSMCSKPCGGGKKYQKRMILTEGMHGGVRCRASNLLETRDCNIGFCDQDCVVQSNHGQMGTVQCMRSCYNEGIDHNSIVPEYAVQDFPSPWGGLPAGSAVKGFSYEGTKVIQQSVGSGKKCPDMEPDSRLGTSRPTNWLGTVNVKECSIMQANGRKNQLKNCKGDEVCKARMNLVIVMDASGATSATQYNGLRKFVAGIAEMMLPKYHSFAGIKVGVVHAGNGRITNCNDENTDFESAANSVAEPESVKFKDKAGELSELPEYENRADFKKNVVEEIKKLKQHNGFFNLPQALDKAVRVLQNYANEQDAVGELPWAQKILVVTASKPLAVWPAADAAARVRQSGYDLNFILALPELGDLSTNEPPFLRTQLGEGEIHSDQVIGRPNSEDIDFNWYKTFATFPWQMTVSKVQLSTLTNPAISDGLGQQYGALVCPGGKALSPTKWADRLMERGYYTLNQNRDCWTWTNRVWCRDQDYGFGSHKLTYSCSSIEKCIAAVRRMNRRSQIKGYEKDPLAHFGKNTWDTANPTGKDLYLPEGKRIKAVVYNKNFDEGACYTRIGEGKHDGTVSNADALSSDQGPLHSLETCNVPAECPDGVAGNKNSWRCQAISPGWNHYAVLPRDYEIKTKKGKAELNKYKEKLNEWLEEYADDCVGGADKCLPGK